MGLAPHFLDQKFGILAASALSSIVGNMRRRILRFAVALLALIFTSSHLFYPAKAEDIVDQARPIMLYCDKALYACDGYQPVSDEQYLPPWAPAFKNVQGYYHNDLVGIYRFPSYAVAITRDSEGNGTSVVSCTDIGSAECRGTDVHFRADLPLCSIQTTIDCMREISILDAEGKALEYSIVGEFPTGNPQYFKGSAALKVPNGGGPTLIKVPGAPHNGGNLYLVKSQMTGAKLQPKVAFEMESFAISITAVKLVDGKYTYSGASTNPKLYTRGFSNIGREDGTYPSICGIASPTQCAAKYSLPTGIRFGVTVDLSRKISGWLHGRVKGPIVDVSVNKVGGNTIKVSAEPIKIPVNSIWVSNDTAAQSIKDFYKGKSNSGSPLFGNENKPLSEIALMRDGNTGHNSETFNEYLAWLTTLGDRAQALPTAWSLQTMGNYQIPNEIRQCLEKIDSLAGIVTTNAAEYLDGPPSFDKARGTLDYKVAATHYEPDGSTVFKGTYDLVMNSSVARCIYGFTNAPISATVLITSDEGESNVATQVVKEEAGWLALGAYNFTYSSPTIKVKLTGTPVKMITHVKSVKITCVRGKVVKEFSAKKCPKGFKKRG